MTRALFFLTLVGSLSLASPTVRAQGSDVHAAAAAFEEAQRAQLRGDFGQAADLFEIADRSAPSPAALRSAIRNHRAASHPARAATLAAEAQGRYPDDAETSALAATTLSELSPTLARVRLRCREACSVTLDGRAVVDHAITEYDVFVEPGVHELLASWHGHGNTRTEIQGGAGDDRTLELAPPAEVAPEPTPDPEPVDEAPPAPLPAPAASSGLHPAVFGTLAGLAVVGLGITIWSGIDVLNAAADYRADPTHARYDDGVGRELRTNVLIAATGVLAAAALVTVFFTDWDDVAPGPDDALTLRPSFYATPEGGGAMITGRFAP